MDPCEFEPLLDRLRPYRLGVWFLVTAVMGSVGDSADDLFQYAMENRDNIRDVLEDQLGPLPIDSSACPMECLNVDLLEYFLEVRGHHW